MSPKLLQISYFFAAIILNFFLYIFFDRLGFFNTGLNIVYSIFFLCACAPTFFYPPPRAWGRSTKAFFLMQFFVEKGEWMKLFSTRPKPLAIFRRLSRQLSLMLHGIFDLLYLAPYHLDLARNGFGAMFHVADYQFSLKNLNCFISIYFNNLNYRII